MAHSCVSVLKLMSCLNVWNDESQTTAAENLKKDLNTVIPL